MKIIYVLPSLTIRGSNIVFEQINQLSKNKHEIIVTSLDKIEQTTKFPLNATILDVDDAKKEFKSVDAIIGYNPVCALYINDLDVHSRKFYLLLNDERKYYSKEYLSVLGKLEGIKLEIEHKKQIDFIEASYNLPFFYIVPNKSLQTIFSNKKLKTIFAPIGVDHELFYPEQLFPKTNKIRLITEGSMLPWKGTEVINRALAELRSFELWTFGDKDNSFRSDKHWGPVDPTRARQLFSSSDIFINPNLIDGTAEMNLQAMACGCAVLTWPTMGTRMFCDKENYINGDSPNEMADNLKSKLFALMNDNNLLEKYIARGLQIAKKVTWNISNLENELVA